MTKVILPVRVAPNRRTQRQTDQDRNKDRGGRFRKAPTCDGCNKSTGHSYITDTEVCGGGDGPGFFLCDRARCTAKRDALDVEARRTLYTNTRAARQD